MTIAKDIAALQEQNDKQDRAITSLSRRIGSPTLIFPDMKSGTDQGDAGAVADELWRDTADNSVKIGV